MRVTYEEFLVNNDAYSYQETYDYCRAEQLIEKENLDFIIGIKYQEEEE
jgi:hypothetical protein